MLVLLSFGIASFVGTSSSYPETFGKTGAGRRAAATGAERADAHCVGKRQTVAAAIAIIWGLASRWCRWDGQRGSPFSCRQAEKASSIRVAVIQLANTCGAAVRAVMRSAISRLLRRWRSGRLMRYDGVGRGGESRITPMS